MACTMYSCQVVKTRTGSDGSEGDKPRLSKRTVTESALKLADADGLDTLTIRKLAEHLGVTPMALYWHFRSKEDLLEGVAEQVWGEIDVNVDPAAPWWAQLQGMLESLVKVLREPGYLPELAAEERAEQQRRNRVELSMLPMAKYPRLVECAVPMTECDDPEFHYRFGIGLFIDGVKAAAGRGEP